MPEFKINEWIVKPKQNLLVRGTAKKRLEPRVMDLLLYFAERPGEVLSHDLLISEVWPHIYVGDSAVLTAISALRKAFGDDARNPRYIETIPKRGYRLIARSSAGAPVIAVLPFKDLTGAGGHEHIVDGMTDMLIAELGCMPSLKVISRQSAMAFKDTERLLPDVAAELNAGLVVEGSVILKGNELRITVQVIDALADTHVWARTYTAGFEQTFDVQRSIAHDIADSLVPRPERAAEPQTSREIDPDALTHYLYGRFHWYKLHAEHFPLALDHFQKAIRIAPDFGAAYAGVADVWGALGYWGAIAADEAGREVGAALKRANDVDPDSAEVNMLFGAYEFYCRRNWDAARTRLDRAIEINADLAHAHMQKALLLATLREPGSLEEIEVATRLDPLNPVIKLARSLCLASAQRYRESQAEVRQILEVAPGFGPALELAAELAWARGSPQACARERRYWHMDSEVSEIFATSAPGREPQQIFLAIAGLLAERARQQHVSPRVIARMYSLAGQSVTALEVLLSAVADDDLMQIDFIQMTPAFAAVRSLADYLSFARHIGLPAHSIEGLPRS